MRTKKSLTVIISALLLFQLVSCSSAVPNTVASPEDLNGKTVGVLSDTRSATFLNLYSDGFNIRSYQDAEALAVSLRAGELDAAIGDGDDVRTITRKAAGLTTLEEPYAQNDFLIAISEENTALQSNINSALASLDSSGALKKLINAWLDGKEYEYGFTASESSLTLTAAVCPNFYPFAFYNEDGELAGLEIDLARMICSWLDVSLELTAVSQDKLVYTTETGKVNFSIGRITEGDESVIYSDSYMSFPMYIIVRK